MTEPMTSTPLEERTTAAVLDRFADATPDKVAIIDEDEKSMTYHELRDAAYRVSASLGELGVGRQEPVSVMLHPHLNNAIAWLGVTVGGRIHVPINTAYKGDMLSYVMAHAGSRVVIIEDEWCDRLALVADELPELETVVVVGGSGDALPSTLRKIPFDSLLVEEPVRPEVPVAVSDITAILYTSGTEGRSKGVLCPHGAAFSMASYPGLTQSDEVVLVALPLFHAAGLWATLYNALRVGGTVVVLRTFSVSRFWDQVRKYSVTTTVLMGAMGDYLWRQPESPQDRDHSMRYVALVPSPSYIDDFAKRFGVDVGSAYGQTETGTTHVTGLGDSGPAICGRPRAFVEAKIVDEHDGEVPQGQVGEIVMRSREPWAMMLGYHKDPAATVRAQRNLWHHTGDAAYQDESGRFVFVDRKKDALRKSGENVSSFEVEKHILERPDVAEAAVVAVPSKHGEDDIKAVLVMVEGHAFDPVEILKDLHDRIPYFMVPRYLEVRDSLPRTPTHKVRKHELRSADPAQNLWDCEAAGYFITRHALREGSREGAR